MSLAESSPEQEESQSLSPESMACDTIELHDDRRWNNTSENRVGATTSSNTNSGDATSILLDHPDGEHHDDERWTRPESPFFRPSTPPHPSVSMATKISTCTTTRCVVHNTHQNECGNTNSESDGTPSVDLLENKSTLIGTYSNLVTGIIGAGIVGIPYAFKETGLIAGIVLIFAVALLTDKSLRLLIDMGKHASAHSYETLLEAAFGRPGFVFVSMNMFIMSYGAMVAYLLVLKDTIPVVFGIPQHDETKKRMVLVVSSLTVILPLSMQRDMADLSRTSIVSVIFDVLLVVITAICSPVKETMESVGGFEYIWKESVVRPGTLFIGLGVLSFAFVCQDAAFIIAGSLHRPTKERWGKVTTSSVWTCAALSTIIGVTGYLGFLLETQGNILNNFNSPSLDSTMDPGCIPLHTAINVARGLLGATMFCVYPLASYVARHVLVVLLFKGRRAHEGDDHSVLARSDRRIILTVLLYVSAIIPALSFENLGTVLAATGAVGGSCLSYLGPGSAYLAIHGKDFVAKVASWDISRTEKRYMWKYPWRGIGNSAVEDLSVNILQKALRVCLWYICLMPVWITIAHSGECNFQEFQKMQLEMSPLQRRLGRIIHRNSHQASIDVNDVVRATSFNHEHSSLFGDTNTGYGTIENSLSYSETEIVEQDPQDAAPDIHDFVVAIFYMIVGTVALIAGLFSIST